MQKKKKKCKGNGKAKTHSGCGKELYLFRYGLCKDCYKDFLFNTSEGKEILEKSKIKAVSIAKNRVKKQQIQKRKQQKELIRTKSYWEKKLQKEINTIVRMIDRGHNCISSQKKLSRKYDAGHYYSVGSTPTIRFNLHNIFAQNVNENQFNGGNPIGYVRGLKEVFGYAYAEEVICLRAKYHLIKLSIYELKLCIGRARSFIKYVEKLKNKNGWKPFSVQERVELRREGNVYIGIYKD